MINFTANWKKKKNPFNFIQGSERYPTGDERIKKKRQ